MGGCPARGYWRMTQEVFWTVISILVTVVIAMVGAIMSIRSELAKRSDEKWNRALQFARIISDPESSDAVKRIANLALYEIGIEIDNRETRVKSRTRFGVEPIFDTVIDSFDTPPSLEQELEIRGALRYDAEDVSSSTRPKSDIDPDIEILKGYLDFIRSKIRDFEGSFAAAKSIGRSEDDTRIRIFFVLVVFVSGILVLVMRNIGIVLGNIISR